MNAPEWIELIGGVATHLWMSSVAASILILGWWLLRLAQPRWLPSRWSYWCGLLILVRLLWPVSLESRASFWNWLRPVFGSSIASAAGSTMAGGAVTVGEDPQRASDRARESGDIPPIRLASTATAAREPTMTRGAVGAQPFVSGTKAGGLPPSRLDSEPGAWAGGYDPLKWAAVIWLLGALGVLAHAVVRHLRFSRSVRRHAVPVDRAHRALAEAACREWHLRPPVTVFEFHGVASPVVFGCLTPRILLPPGLAASLDPLELRHVVRHELAHIRCGDTFANWLIIAAGALHWFNPIVHTALRQLIADRELARDGLALEGLGDGDRVAYGRTLLKLAESLSRTRLSPGLAPLLTTEKEIKRRITMIKSPSPGNLHWSMRAVCGVALAGAAAITFSAAIGQNEPPAAPPAPPAAPAPTPPLAEPTVPKAAPAAAPQGAAALPSPAKAAGPSPIARVAPPVIDAGQPLPVQPPPPPSPLVAVPAPPSSSAPAKITGGPVLRLEAPGLSPRKVGVQAVASGSSGPPVDRNSRLVERHEKLKELESLIRQKRAERDELNKNGQAQPEVWQDIDTLVAIRAQLVRELFGERFGIAEDATGHPEPATVESIPADPIDRSPGDSLSPPVRPDGEIQNLREQMTQLRRAMEEMHSELQNLQTGATRGRTGEGSLSADERAKIRDQRRKLAAEEASLRKRLLDAEEAVKDGATEAESRALRELKKALIDLELERSVLEPEQKR